jgi:2-phosphoglycerate kinase
MIGTLKFARRITDAGMDAKPAEHFAEEIDDALRQSDLVNKADLKAALADLKSDLFKEFYNARTQMVVWVAALVFLGQVVPALVQLIKH